MYGYETTDPARLQAGVANWRANMILGIWSCLTKPALLTKMFISLLFLGAAEELLTDQSDGADSTDIAVTSSVSTSIECQSLLDTTNYVEKMIFVHCVKLQTIVIRLCSTCGLFIHLTCVRLGKA